LGYKKSTPRSSPPAVCFSAVTYTEEQATIAVPPDPPNHHRLQAIACNARVLTSNLFLLITKPRHLFCRRRSSNLGNDLFLLCSKHHQHYHPGDLIILAFFYVWDVVLSNVPVPPDPQATITFRLQAGVMTSNLSS
jgi:hypothetical protein